MIGPEPNGIIAVLPTRFDADAALDWLQIDGLEKRTVQVLGRREAAVERPPELDHGGRHRREVAAYWALWGGVLGGVAGVGPAAISLAASSVGLEPLMTALAGALLFMAATSALGALGAAIVGVTDHELRARGYERTLADGKFLIVVHTDDPAALRTAQRELAAQGAESVDVHGLPVATS